MPGHLLRPYAKRTPSLLGRKIHSENGRLGMRKETEAVAISFVIQEGKGITNVASVRNGFSLM